jgi:hypothetical protein
MRYKIGQCDYGLLAASPLTLISGNDETARFCQEAADEIRRRQQGEVWTCTSLAEFETHARRPAFLGRWWYSGSADRLAPTDKAAFKRLIEKPVTTGTAILTGTDFSKYRDLSRAVRHHVYTHELSASFPSRAYLVSYIKRRIEARGGCISQGASEDFIRRLGDSYSQYDYWLDCLMDDLPHGSEVKSPYIHTMLKQVQNASLDDFIMYLIRPLSNGDLVRTRKLFKCYRCVIESGAYTALRRLNRRAVQYLELRRLINEGFIPVKVSFTVDDLQKLIGNPPEIARKTGGFSRWDILAWSDGKFRREVEIAASAPLADWFRISLLSAKQCNGDDEAERIFYDILTRSQLRKPTDVFY